MLYRLLIGRERDVLVCACCCQSKWTREDVPFQPIRSREKKIPQSGICPAPCAFQQCASPFSFWGRPHCRLPSKVVFHQRMSSIKDCLPSKVVFHQWSSSNEGYLSSKVVFHHRSTSIEGRLPSNVVFHQRSSSIEGRLSSKVVFHHRSSSIKGHLPAKVVLHLRLSSNKGHFPLLGHFHFWVLALSVA